MRKKNWIIALTFGLSGIIFIIIYNSIINGGLTIPLLISASIGGIIVGLLFAMITHISVKRLLKKIIVETSMNEKVIKEGGANHFKNKEGVGGKLVLTNKRLIFKSHKFNIQNHQQNFQLEEIEKLQITKTLNFIKNGLTIELTGNKKHKFIVNGPKDWIDAILNQKIAS